MTDTDFVVSRPGTLIGRVGGTTNGTTSFVACKDEDERPERQLQWPCPPCESRSVWRGRVLGYEDDEPWAAWQLLDDPRRLHHAWRERRAQHELQLRGHEHPRAGEHAAPRHGHARRGRLRPPPPLALGDSRERSRLDSHRGARSRAPLFVRDRTRSGPRRRPKTHGVVPPQAHPSMSPSARRRPLQLWRPLPRLRRI